MKRKENQATTRNLFFFTLCMLLTVLIAVGCSNEKSENKTASDAMKTTVSNKYIKLDACEVLRSIGIDEVLGEPIGEYQPQIQMGVEGRAISQCRYETILENKSVTLFLRYSAIDKNPKTRAELADSEQSADVMGMGEESTAAIKQGKEIAGLGDLAFTYKMFGLNLMVFWKQHYQMTVMLDGFANDAEAVERARTVAQRVLKELSK